MITSNQSHEFSSYKLLGCFSLLVFILLLVGCNPIEIPKTTGDQINPATVPAGTKGPIQTQVSSQPSEPVVTQRMTATPVVMEAIELTPTPTASPTAYSISKDVIIDKSISPDRRWVATVSIEYVNGEPRSVLKVGLDFSNVVWIVEDVPFEDIPVRGFSFPLPYYWTKDGRYLYFTHHSNGDGCFGGGFHRGTDLQKLDLTTGEVIKFSDAGGTWMTISPNEKKMATLVFGVGGLRVIDLQTGADEIFDQLVTQDETGMVIDQTNIVWSPDSGSVLYVIEAGDCVTRDGYFNWIIRVDLDTRKQKILIAKDERTLVPVSWIEPGRVLVRQDDQLLWMDPQTGAVEPVR